MGHRPVGTFGSEPYKEIGYTVESTGPTKQVFYGRWGFLKVMDASRRLRLVVALLLFGLLSALPTVHAAQSEVTVETPEPELIPPGEDDRVPLRIVYTYEGEGTTSGQVDVHVSLGETSLVEPSVAPSTIRIDVDDQRKRGVGHTNLTVRMAEDASAFEEEGVPITARAEPSGNVEGSNTTTAYVAQAAFAGDLVLSFDRETITVSEGRFTTTTLRIDNEANGRAQGNVSILSAPDGTQVGFSPTNAIDVAATGSARQTIEVAIVKSGSGSAAGEVELRASFHPHGVREPLLASNVATIRVEEGVWLPGPGSVAAAASLAAVAWGLRRD